MDREYLKRVLTYVLVSLAAIGVMIYVGYHMVKSFTSEVSTTPAYIDSFSESVTFDAYILRRERVVTSNSSGTVNYLVADGEKVAAGDELVDICRGGSDGIRERISQIDSMIKTLTEIETSAAYSSTSDAANIEGRIRELLYSVNGSVAVNDLVTAMMTTSQMMSQLNRHAIVTGKIDGFKDELASLKAERESLISQLTDVAETVTSEESAYFFYDVDGYESAFEYDDIDALTVNDIYDLTNAVTVSSQSHVVGKLVLDYVWHIVIPSDREQALFFEGAEGSEYDVVFNAGGETLKMKLRSVLFDTGTDGRAALVFDCSEMPDDFEYTRMQPVTITVNKYAGFRVPLSAIRVLEYDDKAVEGVYILYGGVVYFRRVKVILTQDGYALCDSTAGMAEEEKEDYIFPGETEAVTEPPETEPPPEYESIPYLSLYDLVIISSRGLYDGKIVSG